MITTNETYVKWLRSDTKLSFADWLNATPYGLHDFTIAVHSEGRRQGAFPQLGQRPVRQR
jgi:hypothetical protein